MMYVIYLFDSLSLSVTRTFSKIECKLAEYKLCFRCMSSKMFLVLCSSQNTNLQTPSSIEDLPVFVASLLKIICKDKKSARSAKHFYMHKFNERDVMCFCHTLDCLGTTFMSICQNVMEMSYSSY